MTDILETLLKRRTIRVVATLWAVLAVLTFAVLPAAHLHRSASGSALIHSHVLSHPVQHAGMVDDGDDHGGRTLGVVFTLSRAVDGGIPAAVPAAGFLLGAPETQSRSFSNALEAPVIHGPPRSAVSLRAPPA